MTFVLAGRMPSKNVRSATLTSNSKGEREMVKLDTYLTYNISRMRARSSCHLLQPCRGVVVGGGGQHEKSPAEGLCQQGSEIVLCVSSAALRAFHAEKVSFVLLFCMNVVPLLAVDGA